MLLIKREAIDLLGDLWNRIREEIIHSGPMSYDRFMEMALYDPVSGYYTGERVPFGKQGDFYTAPGLHPVFGETIGDYIETRFANTSALGTSDSPLVIAEVGAGDGRLGTAILRRWRSSEAMAQRSLLYHFLDRSPLSQQIQRERLADLGERARWVSSIDQMQTRVHCIIGNELLDAFPASIVECQGDELVEWRIDIGPDGHAFDTTVPLTRPDILAQIGRFGCPTRRGRFEVQIGTEAWFQDISRRLSPGGLVILMDYGGSSDEIYGEHRPLGTMRGFARHSVVQVQIDAAGLQDITVDVDFDRVQRIASAHGMETVWYGTQAQFLIEAGILQRLTAHNDVDPFRSPDFKRNSAIKHLLMPGLWDSFRVWVGKLRPRIGTGT